MKYKKILSIFLSTLVISVASMRMEKVSAVPQKGDILIQSIHGPNEGIFSDRDGLWQPGMEKTNEFVIINNSDSDIEFKELSIGNKIINDTEAYKEFEEKTNISFLENGKLIYKGSVKDTFKKGDITLEDYIVVKAGEEKVLEMAIETLSSMSNIANVGSKDSDGAIGMKIELDFSLGITYQLAEPTPDPEPNPEPKPEPTPNPGTGSDNTGNLPNTGAIMGSLAKSSVGAGVLLAGALMVKKPRKKGDEYND